MIKRISEGLRSLDLYLDWNRLKIFFRCYIYFCCFLAMQKTINSWTTLSFVFQNWFWYFCIWRHLYFRLNNCKIHDGWWILWYFNFSLSCRSFIEKCKGWCHCAFSNCWFLRPTITSVSCWPSLRVKCWLLHIAFILFSNRLPLGKNHNRISSYIINLNFKLI